MTPVYPECITEDILVTGHLINDLINTPVTVPDYRIQTAIDQLAAEMEVTFKKPVAHTTASNWYKRWLATDRKAFNSNTVHNMRSVSLPPAIYAFVKQWILELIDTGSQVNSATLQPYITAGLKCKGYGFLLADAPGGAGTFKVSRSWIRKVCRQMNLSHRAATSAAQKLPDQWEQVLQLFVYQVAYLTWKHKIPPQLVINGDQTGCNMFPASRNIYTQIGTRHVRVLGLEDKQQIMVMVACSASGDMLPLKVVFQPYVTRVKKELGLPENHPWLLMLDCWHVHLTEDFQDFIKAQIPGVFIKYVPANCTSKAQPCDVGIQKPFKDGTRETAMLTVQETVRQEFNKGRSSTRASHRRMLS
ncbi:hypothetical protein VOLCADRAFT_100971 [Volvox carteri f. nagariensis]|uniref:DDE-1 domain-containing protein n=1 Tax=Volvox carteri f. nagariensis TaxID=3068 RepID=D8ULG0_VOLCA|nr:uncharacterized protein VOLCADRAFT_100971 [Volvox carteri f. nagariensis]EFJ39439.1 hypothetical protein VOLCADRAFT_100971 [Volvox carteri f. nagariensis]|eukprot:XP_002959496.1 hypothetical protein VOLCADRAFT_100971 [Volvox carteri f. nagariensis]